MIIGVLALQGDFDAHRKILEGCAGVSRVVPVRSAEELNECDGLIIPGGESTVMSRLCDRYGLWEPLSTRIEQGMGAFGTCAGLILLSTNIEGGTRNFQQKTLAFSTWTRRATLMARSSILSKPRSRCNYAPHARRRGDFRVLESG
jgi:5'-phosphate synthase pdxT subunit